MTGRGGRQTPQGNTRPSSSGGSANAWGYQGHRFDPETTLQAWGNGSQYYAPDNGRFIQDTNLGGTLARPGGEGEIYRFLRRWSHSNNLTQSLIGLGGRAAYILGDAFTGQGVSQQDRAFSDYADGYIGAGQLGERSYYNVRKSKDLLQASLGLAILTGGASAWWQVALTAVAYGALAGISRYQAERYERQFEGRRKFSPRSSYLVTVALAAGSVMLVHGATWALGQALGAGFAGGSGSALATPARRIWYCLKAGRALAQARRNSSLRRRGPQRAKP